MPPLTSSPITDFPHVFLQDSSQGSFTFITFCWGPIHWTSIFLGTCYVAATVLHLFRCALPPTALLEEHKQHPSIQYGACVQGNCVALIPLNGNKNEQWHFCGLAFSSRRTCITRLMIFFPFKCKTKRLYKKEMSIWLSLGIKIEMPKQRFPPLPGYSVALENYSRIVNYICWSPPPSW